MSDKANRVSGCEQAADRAGGASYAVLMSVRRVLFVCSQNRLRSPTAEQVFASWPGVEVSSAGLNHDAEEPLTAEMVREADLIFVMERAHRTRLSRRFKADLKRARVVCLDIPDDYDFMDPTLVALLQARVPRHLPTGQP